MDVMPTGEIVTLGYNEVRVWDVDKDAGMKSVACLKGQHTTDIYGVRVIPSTLEIVTASHDQTIKIWRNSGTEWKVEKSFRANCKYLYALAMLPSGNVVSATSSSPYNVEVYNTATAEREFTFANSAKLFETLGKKIQEYETVEKEGELKKCISKHGEIYQLLQKIEKATAFGEQRMDRTKKFMKERIAAIEKTKKDLEEDLIKVTKEMSGMDDKKKSLRQEAEKWKKLYEPLIPRVEKVKREYNKGFEKWTNQDVVEWLASEGFGDYIGAFTENKIKGAELTELTSSELHVMGIRVYGDRKRFFTMCQGFE
eukprot:UN25206